MIAAGVSVMVSDPRWMDETGTVIEQRPGGRWRVVLDSGPVIVVSEANMEEA